MSFPKPSKNSFGLEYFLQVKWITLQPFPRVALFFPAKDISSLPPICSVLLHQIITALAFNSVFHFQDDIFCGVSLQNVALSSLGFISSLLMAWTHPFHLSHSPISSCVLLEDLFSVSHLTVSSVEVESLFPWILFFSPANLYQFTQMPALNPVSVASVLTVTLSFFLLRFVGQSQFTVNMFLHSHRNLQISADYPAFFL